ncbi:MAG: alpha/beta fold hydrolase [Galactobacter sp.]
MSPISVLLLPGAWMGGWIWESTLASLQHRGLEAHTMTLAGLAPGTTQAQASSVTLEEHVQQLLGRIRSLESGRIVVVSHSYSAVVAEIASRRRSDAVAGVVHLGGFVPRSSRSLLDEWGGSEAERAQELADIQKAGNLWMPPTAEMLSSEPGLSEDQRAWLAERFVPHPGSTVTTPVPSSAETGQTPTTYVTLSPTDDAEQAWRDAPAAAVSSPWNRRHLNTGHWPMLSSHEDTVELLVQEIDRFTR